MEDTMMTERQKDNESISNTIHRETDMYDIKEQPIGNGDDIYIGIDLSLNSPGMSIYIENENTVYAYYFPTRVKDINRRLDTRIKWNSNARFLLCPFHKQNQAVPLLDRYHSISSTLVGTILKHSKNNNKVRIRMEGYAFGCKSSSTSKLHELGGILKYQLYLNGFSVEEISPTSLKKRFSNCGRSSKSNMYEKFLEKGFPMLKETFEMEKCKNVPNPVQDIVDSCALMESFFHTPLKNGF